MDNKLKDSYQDGASGRQFTGSTAADSIDYSRGKADQGRGAGGGMLVAAVLLSPVICAAYPVAGLATLGLGFLVSRGGPFFGIESGSGILIVVTLVALIAAFFGGLAAERRISTSKPYRTVRWILRLLLVPTVLAVMLSGERRESVSIEHVVLLLILVPISYWLLKGLDRFVGATGVNQEEG